jgi:X-Pro dipeptidyl-peptidase
LTNGRGHWRFAAFAAALFAILATPAVAVANGGEDGPSVVVSDGVTQPVFGYADAVRQRVWVEADFDTNLDGIKDRIAMDIIRPKASDAGLKVPVIMDASPYYSTLGRGNEGELKRDLDGDGLLDRWPLYYDNYFVPRGYAVVLLDMVGTNNSTGCPQTGDPAEHLSAVVGIDWLNGRRAGYDKDGNQVFASWHNGKTGMIGKSYDGTLANGAASTGVQGLTTIVPLSAISSWYDYARSNGIRFNNNYPSSLSNTVTDPADRAGCATVRLTLDATDGDESGDYTPFWQARDYNPNVDKVHASVFAVHGINDNNVKPDHLSKWWYGLEANNVPRKLWVTQTGHIDPFDFRRTEWVDTLHRWFDYWLQDVQTGIMREPEVDFERSAETWEVAKTWPAQNSTDTNLWLQPSETPGTFGTLTKQRPSKKQAPVTFLDNPNQSQTNMISITAAQGLNRLVFLSPTLLTDLRFSGTPRAELVASADKTDTNFGVLVVDYGTDERVQYTMGDGLRTKPLSEAPETCWGEANPAWGEDACYLQTIENRVTAASELVTKGILDAQNRNSYATTEPLVIGQSYGFNFPLLPEDYVFKAGHRLGVVVVGSYSQYSSIADQTRANITLNVRESSIVLPIVGGSRAAVEAGL